MVLNMDISLLGHSAVAFTKNRVLVIDPGVYSDTTTLGIACAVLLTHSHPDHMDASALARTTAKIYGPSSIMAELAEHPQHPIPQHRLHPLQEGELVDIAGFQVQVLGGEHAVVHPEIPSPPHLAYLIEQQVLHPGDSLVVYDDVDPDVVLLPVVAPWLKLADAVDFARAYPRAKLIPIHDGILSGAGKTLIDGVAGRLLGPRYVRGDAELPPR